ncbi:GNAT family N-acetyltransferase [Sphingomonas oleivorans]|uniref:GNAT family N-acetyltransferase n=2 Tax=Sphingomonas oleivorans TaxID=1735121 RepID=A0A2T5FZY3_9SPHN|nr:GNAT family protein [Sphingomonas oleivorans]PTQ12261.1 GNAT family N-acetyltransferase [Sphingomonas oleivorans]
MAEADLFAPMGDGTVHLEQVDQSHREAMRVACAADEAIWDIYPMSLIGEHFDPGFDAILANPQRRPFALFAHGGLIGMSGYLNIDRPNRVLEIGGTYIEPAARGTGLNGRIKRLLIDRAIACGFQRIEFRIDIRNGRSMAAVEKLGAVREGVMRRQRITWTGHVRDTALYSILAEEWTGASRG